jgi:hypothetical protein
VNGEEWRVAKTVKKKQLSIGLSRVETLTALYALKWNAVIARVSALQTEIKNIERQRITSIRKAVEAARDARAELAVAIEEYKPEFEKPRSRMFHGIKVGFRKLVGTLTWKDPDQVVKLIKKNFPDKATLLIKTTETPVKDALGQLSAADLKKLGCSVGDDTDEVVISPAKTDVQKLVDALLKGSAVEEGSD